MWYAIHVFSELDFFAKEQTAKMLNDAWKDGWDHENVITRNDRTAQDAMDDIGKAFEKFCQATGGETHGSGQDHGGDPAEMRT